MLSYISGNNILWRKKLKAFHFLNFFLLLTLSLWADDQVKLRNGNTVTGKITGASNGTVAITISTSTGGTATQSIYFTDIKSVTMSPPAEFTQAQKGDVATKIRLLTPLVTTYQGLPADWVVDAMAQLADAYDAQNQPDKSLALYNQINQLYPGSPYQIASQVGKAKIALKAGHMDEASTALKPLLEQADKTLAPAATEGRLYAQAYFVQGQILEAQKKFPESLEAYLTIKTFFYQDADLVNQAETAANRLRTQTPTLSVN